MLNGFRHIATGKQMPAKLADLPVELFGGAVNGCGMFSEKNRQLRERKNILQRPKKIGGCRGTLRLVKPRKREFADNGIIFEALRLLQFDERFDSQGVNRAPLSFHPTCRCQLIRERIYARRIAHYVQKNFIFTVTGQDKMKTVSALKMFNRKRRCQLVVTRPTITQRQKETVAVFFSRVYPKINIFGKCGRAIKHRGLAADEQILDPVSVKALEKVCDHAQPSSQEAANASANCGATARAESGVAIRPPCRARPLLPIASARLWHQSYDE